MRIHHLLSALAVMGLLSGCGGSNSTPAPSTNTGHQCGSLTRISDQLSDSVNISGTISFDLVPNADNGSLDFDNTTTQPAKSVTVQAISSECVLFGETITNDAGEYSVQAPIDTDVFIRAVAEITHSDTARWNVSIRDNTSNNGVYVLDGNTINTGASNGIRNLHASSGWSGSSYTEPRNAAPFAILDAVHQIIEQLLEVDNDIQLPSLQIRWSIENVSVSGNLSNGEIGTSFYRDRVIYLLGSAEAGDTDEYDRSVVQHEFGHYLEDQISRSDSIGGPHSTNSRLDMRVAFSEGFGNALTAMITGTGRYYDSILSSFGNRSFFLDIENTDTSNHGWYSEDTAAQILYDIFDADIDGNDSIALGLAPIYGALTDMGYVDGQARTSIYSFLTAIERQVEFNDFLVIETLAQDYDVNVTNAFGYGETNDGGSDIVLPLYREITVGGSLELCSDNEGGSPNGFDVIRFVTLNIESEGEYEFTAVKTSDTDNTRDPDILVYNAGNLEAQFDSGTADIETGSENLSPGTYLIEFFDYHNIEPPQNPAQSGRECFTLSVNNS